MHGSEGLRSYASHTSSAETVSHNASAACTVLPLQLHSGPPTPCPPPRLPYPCLPALRSPLRLPPWPADEGNECEEVKDLQKEMGRDSGEAAVDAKGEPVPIEEGEDLEEHEVPENTAATM